MVFLSSGDEYLGELLELHQGCQGPCRGSRGKVGFLSRRRSGKGPHLMLRGESPGFSRVEAGSSQVTAGLQRPSHVATGKASLHASCEGPLGIPLQSLPGPMSSLEMSLEHQGPSQRLARILRFLWSFNRVFRHRLMWRHASPFSSRVVTVVSWFLSS